MDTRRIIAVALFALIAWTTGAAFTGPPDEGQTAKHRSSPGGWLGVSIQDMTQDLAQSMKVKTDSGALVSEVMEESPAERPGLKEEDIITKVGTESVEETRAQLPVSVRQTTAQLVVRGVRR